MKIKSIKNVGRQNVYDIAVDDVEHYALENGVVTHNSGIYYSSNNIFVIGRSQVKEKSELAGYEFKINIEKSRGCKEKTQLPFTVKFDGGIDKYAGLFDVALEVGFIVSPSQAYYSRKINGELEESRHRKKAVEHDPEFWKPLIDDPAFDRAIRQRYKLVSEPAEIEDDIDLDVEL